MFVGAVGGFVAGIFLYGLTDVFKYKEKHCEILMG